MAMTNKLARRLTLALGLAFAASAAQAQDAPPSSGVDYGAPVREGAAAPESRRERRERRADIAPYLEVAQGISTEFGGDTLTYTTLAAGVDGSVQTRRVTAVLSYRYDRLVEWNGNAGDTDTHSGIAAISAQVVPGAVNIEAGALATRTGGEGRALGVTERDQAVELYSVYAGPTVSTHVGPVAVNASYRLGYVAIDDDSVSGGPDDGYDSAIAHSATASAGMAPGRLPFGWTVGAGYARSESDSDFDDELEGAYVRGDVVVPVSPTLALTAGVGYENIEASQLDVARDGAGIPLVTLDGRPVPDPAAPRLLTYDVSGVIYDAGVIWRPSPRTELQARAGHRYGGTTVVGSLSHRFNSESGIGVTVYDTVETFGGSLVSNLSNLPDDFEVARNPLTGDLTGCAFGSTPGTGGCLGGNLQSIRGGTFRSRGASAIVSTNRGRWSFGAGAGYSHRRFARPDDSVFDVFGGSDESFALFAGAGRQLSRSSEINFSAYASWFDSDQPGFNRVFSTGGTASYSRRLLLDRLQFQAALGLNHSDDGVEDSTIASAIAGLRYTF